MSIRVPVTCMMHNNILPIFIQKVLFTFYTQKKKSLVIHINFMRFVELYVQNLKGFLAP